MAKSRTRKTVVDQELQAFEQAERQVPEEDPSLATFGRDVPEQDFSADAVSGEDASISDWAVAERALPDLPDENEDGLDAIDEEVVRQAEELPAEDTLHERIRRKAYELWQSEGGSHGRHEDHWALAEALVAEEDADRSDVLPFAGNTEGLVEEESLLDNLGEFPTLDDQGDSIDRPDDAMPDSPPKRR